MMRTLVHSESAWGNTLTKEQADASNKAFDEQRDRDEAAGAAILRSKGLPVSFTTRERRAAELKLNTAAGIGTADDWRVEARARVAKFEVETGVTEPSDPQAWLAAAWERANAVEVEMRRSSASFGRY
jgi:nucleoid-associated protein YgaU